MPQPKPLEPPQGPVGVPTDGPLHVFEARVEGYAGAVDLPPTPHSFALLFGLGFGNHAGAWDHGGWDFRTGILRPEWSHSSGLTLPKFQYNYSTTKTKNAQGTVSTSGQGDP